MKMTNLTDEQRAAIERLQAQQPSGAIDERRKFMRGILSVAHDDLKTTPEPPPQKQGRKPKVNPSA